ncbi:hypothetical protein RT97_06325 [Variovorax paradoxus]|uniref:Uncharacterized protein n=1 Tax=Variovorax paradoxus TaxID=34073 RepID=A0A0D0LZP7_VARPD|nr:hypothetical protein [Variovorax paradoxus]KIQ34863.1 hypothetical protein RT97_06325 [Variovorax paradoxus]
MIAEVAEQHSAVMVTEQECRAFLLSKLLGRPTDKFFAVAKEISDLLKMRQEFRALHESEPDHFWRSVYDRDSKPRLIAVTLGAITLFTALTIRSIPEGPSLFDVLNDEASLAFVWKFVLLCGSMFLLLVLARVVGTNFWHVATTWWTKSVSGKESRTALRHLARDLVLYHRPVVTKDGEGSTVDVATQEAQHHRAPGERGAPGDHHRAVQLAVVCSVVLVGVLGARRLRTQRQV